MKEIDNYLNKIQESFLFSNETLSFDLDKFESGKINKLIVIGAAGGGKSTLGRKLAKKYKCKFFEGDKCWEPAQKKFPKIPVDEKEYNEFNDIYYNCLIKKLKSSEKLVVEGIGFVELVNGTPEERDLVLKFPVIVLGTSALKATLQATSRAKKNKQKGKELDASPIISFIYYGMFNFLGIVSLIKKFKKLKSKISGTKIKSLKL